MFTGLIERIGRIEESTPRGDARRLVIAVDDDAYLSDAVMGESISVNGICLTVVELEPRRFAVEAVEETMRRTALGSKEIGAPVNLERALVASARLGGHMVQGHVDGIGTVTGVRPEGEGWWVTVEPPFDLMRYVVEKGSICIDGISLTVANVAYSRFSVALIPHTRAVTTAGVWSAGMPVNLETDVLAKYVERLMQWSASGGAWTTVEIQ
ncbi:MAG TPA: riboflavin synthase [Abditibacteriaceae bacterium]|nr:riboflavin synthase [Abditibacteriaceae bacterium]